MTVRPFSASRNWTIQGPNRYVDATLIAQTKKDITIQPQGGQAETLPMRLIDPDDRRLLNSGQALGRRMWTLKTEEAFEGTLAGFPGRDGIPIQTSGETRRIDKFHLSPTSRDYVQKINALQ
jgi:hypothetical protein